MELLSNFDLSITLDQAGNQLLIDIGAVIGFALGIAVVSYGVIVTFDFFRELVQRNAGSRRVRYTDEDGYKVDYRQVYRNGRWRMDDTSVSGGRTPQYRRFKRMR